MELGREDVDGADRYEMDVCDRWSKKPECLDFVPGSGDPIASSTTGTEKACSSSIAACPPGDSAMLAGDAMLFGCQKADSETVSKDNCRPPLKHPGEEGNLGSIDMGLGGRLDISAFCGEVVADETSSFMGDWTSIFVKTSILFSRRTFMALSSSVSRNFARMLSSSHSSSPIFAPFRSISSSNCLIYCLNSISTSLRRAFSSCTLTSYSFSHSATSCFKLRFSTVSALNLAERFLVADGDSSLA